MWLAGLWLLLLHGVVAPPPVRPVNDDPYDFFDSFHSFHETFKDIFADEDSDVPSASKPVTSTTSAPPVSMSQQQSILDKVPREPPASEAPPPPTSSPTPPPSQPPNPGYPPQDPGLQPSVPSFPFLPSQPQPPPQPPTHTYPNPGYPPSSGSFGSQPSVPSYPNVPGQPQPPTHTYPNAGYPPQSSSGSQQPQQPQPHTHTYPTSGYYTGGRGPYYPPHSHPQYPYGHPGQPHQLPLTTPAPTPSQASSTPSPINPEDPSQNQFDSQEPTDTFNGYVEPSDTPYYYTSGGYNPSQSYNYLSQTYGNYGKFNTIRGQGSYGPYQRPYSYAKPQYQPRPPDLSGLSEECSTPDGSIGQCMSSSFKCTYVKGEPSGFCAKKSPWFPTRTCCVQKAKCGGYPARSRVVNIQSPNYPNTTNFIQNCPVTVLVQPQVCQVRLDFLDFDMKPLENGFCEDSNSLHIQSSQASTRIPMSRLCGILSSGEKDPFRTDHPHLYIHFPDSLGAEKHILPQTEDFLRSLSLTFNVRNYTSKWNIRLTKIPCDGSILKAPEACSQYYHERSGKILSLNYLDGQYPAKTKMEICIEKTPSDCGIEYKLEKLGVGSVRAGGLGYGLVCQDFLMFRGEKTAVCGRGDGRVLTYPAKGPLGFTFYSERGSIYQYQAGFNLQYSLLQNCSSTPFTSYPSPRSQ